MITIQATMKMMTEKTPMKMTLTLKTFLKQTAMTTVMMMPMLMMMTMPMKRIQ